MKFSHLSETVKIKTISEDATSGVFEIEGLYTGYGLTIGNALRRALLSSLPGAAVTAVKIKNALHEFTTLPGVKEDIVEISLNLKNLRFRFFAEEPQVLRLNVKGERVVRGGDIESNSQVEIVNPEAVIATLTSKSAVFDAEITVEKGLGYSPVEGRKVEKLPVGVILIDAFFSPVREVSYRIENMRVGEYTTFNRLRLEIKTDGSITPSTALHKSANILKDHFEKISGVQVQEIEAPKPRKSRKKKNAAS